MKIKHWQTCLAKDLAAKCKDLVAKQEREDRTIDLYNLWSASLRRHFIDVLKAKDCELTY